MALGRVVRQIHFYLTEDGLGVEAIKTNFEESWPVDPDNPGRVPPKEHRARMIDPTGFTPTELAALVTVRNMVSDRLDLEEPLNLG